jgi:hypothetical protein
MANSGNAHDHEHSLLVPCSICWARLARPFGARLARFFRRDALDDEDAARIRKRLQRPLSMPTPIHVESNVVRRESTTPRTVSRLVRSLSSAVQSEAGPSRPGSRATWASRVA